MYGVLFESATSKEFLLVFLDILRFLNLVLSSIVVDLTYCRLHFFALDLMTDIALVE